MDECDFNIATIYLISRGLMNTELSTEGILVWFCIYLSSRYSHIAETPQKSVSLFRMWGIVQDTERNRFPHAFLLVLLRAIGV